MTEQRRRDLEPVEAFLDGVLSQVGASPGSTLAVVRSRWDELAGPGWEDTRPTRLDRGVLVVEVPDGTTASRLQFDAHRVVGAVAEVTVPDAVRTIRFRVKKGF